MSPRPDELGDRLWEFVENAWPLCRSLTGDGVRQTLELLGRDLPLEIHEVPTGTRVLDWEVPAEWNPREAWIEGPGGERVVDFADHNLHLVGYSEPIDTTLSLAELRPHLHSLPDRPERIPYRTSYYRRTWGFCLPHRVLEGLGEGDYRVHIDADLEDGALTYGELLVPGESDREMLLSAHVCHPSLANDNLSGIAVCLGLARALLDRERRRLSYRFVFAPGTLGAITWLARNADGVERVDHGLVAANLGDDGEFHYKRSRRGDAAVDRAVERVFAEHRPAATIEDFSPFGYDERQYGSPGFDLAVGSLTRTPWGRYPEYHTSADDLDLISAANLVESVDTYLRVIDVLEHNRLLRNRKPYGEPQLGRRGLYRSLGGDDEGRERELALLWVLNQSDGGHDLLAIAERSGMSWKRIVEAAESLEGAGLVEEVAADGSRGS